MAHQQEVGRLLCQRIGCYASFTEEDNPDDSCCYHESTDILFVLHGWTAWTALANMKYKGPVFHDGMKEWSCCKKRSHDFSLFLEIPGCKTGKHTTEKPVSAKVTASPKTPISPQTAAPPTNSSTKESCLRCKQGFYCSDHGSQPNQPAPAPANSKTEVQQASAPVKKVVDINQPQTCKNQGCGKTFKEKDNHETACDYHPGPPVFHDRMRGWKCCDIHAKEFDEFMSIPPCTKGWHNADPVS